MARKRLFDMQIDEVSLVDRPANQHATIAFSKADDDNGEIEFDELYDADGNAVDLATLQPGDEISDGESTYVITEGIGGGEEVDEYEPGDVDDEYEPEDEDGEEVGKGFGGAWRAFKNNVNLAAKGQGAQAERAASYGVNENTKKAAAAGRHVGRNKKAYMYGGAGAGLAGAGGIGYGMTQKNDDGSNMSYTDEVLEELSKAVNDSEREVVIAKMASELETTRAQAEEAIAKAEEAEYREMEMEFVSKAAEYNLPVSPEYLGPILMKMAMVLEDEELETIDKVFSAVGDALYDEIGYVGGGDNVSIMDQVDSLADEMVGKSDGQFSKAESMVAMLEANPDAYDAYLSEMDR